MDLLAIAVAAFVQYAPAEALTMIVCTRPEPLIQYIPTDARALSRHSECAMVPPTRVPHPTVYAGPFKDWEGDDFYIAEYQGYYFPLWPGKNASPIAARPEHGI